MTGMRVQRGRRGRNVLLTGMVLFGLAMAPQARADGPVPPPEPPAAIQTEQANRQEPAAVQPDVGAETPADAASAAPETRLREPQLSDLAPYGVAVDGPDGAVRLHGRKLGGLYDLRDGRVWSFEDEIHWDSYDPDSVYAVIAYDDGGFVSNVLPVPGKVFNEYAGNGAKWKVGGPYFGLTEAGVTPDENFHPFYQGKPVLGIMDPRGGIGYFEWHLNPETGEPYDEADLADEGVYLRVTYDVQVIDREMFETGVWDDYRRMTEESKAGDAEYRQFGYVHGYYQGDKEVVGFWDPGRKTFLNMLHDEEEEALTLYADRPEKNPTFLVAVRDADGYLTGFDELTLEAFVKVLRDNNLVGRG